MPTETRCENLKQVSEHMSEKHEFGYFSALRNPSLVNFGTDTASGTPDTEPIKRSVFEV